MEMVQMDKIRGWYQVVESRKHNIELCVHETDKRRKRCHRATMEGVDNNGIFTRRYEMR